MFLLFFPFWQALMEPLILHMSIEHMHCNITVLLEKCVMWAGRFQRMERVSKCLIYTEAQMICIDIWSPLALRKYPGLRWRLIPLIALKIFHLFHLCVPVNTWQCHFLFFSRRCVSTARVVAFACGLSWCFKVDKLEEVKMCTVSLYFCTVLFFVCSTVCDDWMLSSCQKGSNVWNSNSERSSFRTWIGLRNSLHSTDRIHCFPALYITKILILFVTLLTRLFACCIV